MTSEHDIKKLSDLLKKLETRHKAEGEDLRAARQLVESIRDDGKIDVQRSNIKNNTKQRNPIVKGSALALGDWVSIRNPKAKQPNEGKVVGRTRIGFVKVKGRYHRDRHRQVIQRIPENLIFERHEGEYDSDVSDNQDDSSFSR